MYDTHRTYSSIVILTRFVDSQNPRNYNRALPRTGVRALIVVHRRELAAARLPGAPGAVVAYVADGEEKKKGRGTGNQKISRAAAPRPARAGGFKIWMGESKGRRGSGFFYFKCISPIRGYGRYLYKGSPLR